MIHSYHKKCNLIKKYSNIPVPVRASIWFVICSIMQKGISLLTVPLFTRLLTTEQYGVYSVYQSWYNIVAIFATLNLSLGIFYNGMIKYEHDRERFTSAMQGLATTVTLSIAVIYLVFRDFWNSILQLDTLFVIAMFVELLFVPAYQLWSARQRFDYHYRNLIIATMIIAVCSPIVGLIAVLNTEYKAEARVLSYVGVQVMTGLVLYINNLIKGKSFCVKKYWKFALAFNIPLIPHYLSMSILGQSDRIMISRMTSTDEAAIYSVAYNVSQLMLLITTAISNSFNPYSYKALKEKKYKDIGTIANQLLLLVAVGCCIVMLLGPEIIRIFAAPEYFAARWVIPPVAASVFFIFCYPLFSNIEFYFEKNKYVMCASIVGAITNIILNYLLIPAFGFVAAGYTTLFCYILFVVCHYMFHRIVLAQNAPGVKIYNMKFIIAISVSVIVIMTIIVLTYSYDILRYLVTTIIFIILLLKRKKIVLILGIIRKKKG